MSQENLNDVKAVYADWERGRLAAGQSLYDPEITVETFMPDAGESVTLRGVGQFTDFVREWLTQWEEYRVTGEDFREVEDDKVLVSGRQIAIGHRSGVAVESPAFAVWTFRRGKVIRLTLHYDRADALAAAGLAD